MSPSRLHCSGQISTPHRPFPSPGSLSWFGVSQSRGLNLALGQPHVPRKKQGFEMSLLSEASCDQESKVRGSLPSGGAEQRADTVSCTARVLLRSVGCPKRATQNRCTLWESWLRRDTLRTFYLPQGSLLGPQEQDISWTWLQLISLRFHITLWSPQQGQRAVKNARGI